MRKFKEKFTVFFLGIILSIFLIEIALRIIGCIHLKTVTSDKVVQKGESSYVILCVGDSFTEGIGDSRGKGYPSRLEDLLSSIDREKIFIVINQGIAGHNTAQILDELKDNIDKIKPALVVLLAGGANNWNYWGYQEYLKGKTLFSTLHTQLCRVRIYKLIKLLFLNIKNKIDKIPLVRDNLQFNMLDTLIYKKERNNKERVERFAKNMKLNPDNSRNYTVFGWACEEQGRYEEASRWFKKGIKLDPDDSENYTGLGWVNLHQRKNAEASKWFKKGVKVNSSDSSNYTGLGLIHLHNREFEEATKWFKEGVKLNPDNNENYRGIGSVYEILRNSRKHEAYFEIINFLRDLETDNPFVLNYIEMFEKESIDKEIGKWVKSDIGKIIQMCQGEKIKLIVQNYPGNDRINESIKESAAEYSAPFVDNEYLFSELWEKGEKEGIYFVSDGHCNAKGYNVMAKNIYEKIIEEKLFNPF